MKALTQKQDDIFQFILTCARDENYVPTIREIADHFGFASTNAVRDHLAAIERKGYISRRAHSSRGIEIAPEYLQERQRGLAIVGRVAAGAPIMAIENLDGYLEIENLYDPQRHFALHVRGDSMVDDGIWDGDFVIVRDQPEVANGEIAVAIVEGEATVKRVRREGNTVQLIPANEMYQPLIVDLATTEFRIGGKVVGVHRVIR